MGIGLTVIGAVEGVWADERLAAVAVVRHRWCRGQVQ